MALTVLAFQSDDLVGSILGSIISRPGLASLHALAGTGHWCWLPLRHIDYDGNRLVRSLYALSLPTPYSLGTMVIPTDAKFDFAGCIVW